MIEKLVKSIIQIQLGYGTIQKDDVKIYQYGYTLLIEVSLNIVLSLILSVLLGKFKEYIFFLCMFIPLRSFCGGYHAKKAWQCVVFSNVIIVLVLVFAELVIQYSIPIFVYSIGDICLGMIIVYFSPVESCNNKLNEVEKKYYQKYVLIILSTEIMLGNVVLIFGYQGVFNVILGVHILQFFSLLVEIVRFRNIHRKIL